MDELHRFQFALQVIGNVAIHRSLDFTMGTCAQPQQAAGRPITRLKEAHYLEGIHRDLRCPHAVVAAILTEDASVGCAEVVELWPQ
jgi:hypothetical protein